MVIPTVEPRHDCILCGRKTVGPPFGYPWSNDLANGEIEPIFEYYLCEYHAGQITAESVERMIRRRMRIRRST
jgi:hypothetical protein